MLDFLFVNFDDPAQGKNREVRALVRSHVSFVQHRRQESAEGRPQRRPRPRHAHRSINAWAPHDSRSGPPPSSTPTEGSISSANSAPRSESNRTTQQQPGLHGCDQLRRPRPGHTLNAAELPVRSATQHHVGQNQRQLEGHPFAPAHSSSTRANASGDPTPVSSSWPSQNGETTTTTTGGPLKITATPNLLSGQEAGFKRHTWQQPRPLASQGLSGDFETHSTPAFDSSPSFYLNLGDPTDKLRSQLALLSISLSSVRVWSSRLQKTYASRNADRSGLS